VPIYRPRLMVARAGGSQGASGTPEGPVTPPPGDGSRDPSGVPDGRTSPPGRRSARGRTGGAATHRAALDRAAPSVVPETRLELVRPCGQGCLSASQRVRRGPRSAASRTKRASRPVPGPPSAVPTAISVATRVAAPDAAAPLAVTGDGIAGGPRCAYVLPERSAPVARWPCRSVRRGAEPDHRRVPRCLGAASRETAPTTSGVTPGRQEPPSTSPCRAARRHQRTPRRPRRLRAERSPSTSGGGTQAAA
jgi:hypothetical protein